MGTVQWWNNFKFIFSLVGVQRRISQGLKVLQYYTTKNWTFKNEKFLRMKENMSRKDQEMFYFSVEEVNQLSSISIDFWAETIYSSLFLPFQIDWNEYLGNYILGARHFLLKEKPETLPKARVLLHRLYLLDKLVSILFYGLIFWLMYSYWSNIIYSFESVLDKSAGFFQHRFTKVLKDWTVIERFFKFFSSFFLMSQLNHNIHSA